MVKKRIKPKATPNQLVRNKIQPIKEMKVSFDFTDDRWLSSVKVGDFTNYVGGPEQCLAAYYNIFAKIIPKVIQEWEQIKVAFGSRQYEHCHVCIDEKDVKARNIFKKIYNYDLDIGIKIYQFSFTGATRLICLLEPSNNILKPIFVDHHHLIYPSKYFNQPDFEKFDYCMRCAHK